MVDAAGAFAIEIMERCLNGTIDIRNGSEAAKLMEAMRGFIADVRGPAAHGGIIEARLIDPTAAFNNLMSLAASEARVPKEQER